MNPKRKLEPLSIDNWLVKQSTAVALVLSASGWGWIFSTNQCQIFKAWDLTKGPAALLGHTGKTVQTASSFWRSQRFIALSLCQVTLDVQPSDQRCSQLEFTRSYWADPCCARPRSFFRAPAAAGLPLCLGSGFVCLYSLAVNCPKMDTES